MSPVTYEEFGKNAARMFEAAVESAYKDLLEKAVAEAVAAEREACAQIAEHWRCNGAPRHGVAAEIRARGNK